MKEKRNEKASHRIDWAGDSGSRYLLFSLGGELYGTPILGVREVLEPQPVKPIPNAVKYFCGVINVRGEIVGVVDLRLRFGHPAVDTPTRAFVVFDSAVGPIGAVVDKVEMVASLGEEDIERNPRIETDVPSDFLIGVGKFEDRLVSLIDFNKALGAEDLSRLSGSKLRELRNC